MRLLEAIWVVCPDRELWGAVGRRETGEPGGRPHGTGPDGSWAAIGFS